MSKKVLIDPNNKNFKWYREVRLVAKAEPIHIIPKPDILKFGKVGNGGLTFSIDLLANENIGATEVQKLIWDLFKDFLCADITVPVLANSSLAEVAGAKEGDTRIIPHMEQEIRYRKCGYCQKKKTQALEDGNGRIKCECCDFDFFEIYDEVGEGYIECHHKIFLHHGERITNPDDLALVCSNCHRMLHRRKANNTYYSAEEIPMLLRRGK